MRASNNRRFYAATTPIIPVVAHYIDLLESIRHTVIGNGLRKLFLCQSCTMSVIDMSPAQVNESITTLKNISGLPTGFMKQYANTVVTNNITNFLNILRQVMRARMDEIATLPPADPVGKPGLENNPRNWYYPSPASAGRLVEVVDWAKRRNKLDPENTIGYTAMALQFDINELMGNGGVGLTRPRCDDDINYLLNNQDVILDSIDSQDDFRKRHLPLLKIYLAIARALTGSVDRLDMERQIARLPPALADIRISDTTLAALPLPVPEMVSSFEDEDCAVLSMKGRKYLIALQGFYATSLSRQNADS